MKFYLRILSLLLLLAAALTQDGFNLEDALFDDPTPAPPKKQPVTPKRPGSDGGFGLDLGDALGPDPTPKKPQKPSSGDTGGFGLDLEDALGPDPTPKKPRKPSSGDTGGFDLEDALGPDPAPEPKKPADKPRSGGGGTFSDNDLFDVSNGDYKPDEGRSGGRAKDTSYDNQGGNDQAQGSGQIAGIISAVGVALLGAASSYFAYQKKKLCFKLQGGADPESGKGPQGGRSDNQVFSNLLQNN
ncbi:PREDICTED: CD99 antigen-like isoform X2 [Cyprinodon variegatus]|uniref:CD99 antigen-like isoform X2 n=1 Tax=Cyprinodon variegatus TaxID=28743 RepID=UPI000742BAEB|nr:PREDICTED: CD99 antigen-like isoform X2 [Cyprinodon variegatus]